jgi:excisionase family DNA binding protein
MPYEHDRPVAVIAYSLSGAAAATGLKISRIQAAVRDGSLRAARVGVKTKILRSDIEAWILSHPPATREAGRHREAIANIVAKHPAEETGGNPQ